MKKTLDKYRPRIRIEWDGYDKTLEGITVSILFILWIVVLAGYERLPETIPVHFDAAGKPDDYGSRSTILLLPAVATLLYAGMTILNRYPHIFNYPNNIHEGNAEKMYRNATKLIRFLKLVIVLIFTGIVLMTYRAVFSEGKPIGSWFLIICLILIFIPTIYFLIRSRKI